MFRLHRADLKEAHAAEVKALKLTIEALAEQVEYLRAKLDGHGFVSARVPPANPTGQAEAEVGWPKWMSEEEEDLLALNLNNHITDLELQELRSQLGMPGLAID